MREDKFILRWAKRYRAIQELGGKCVKCGENNMFLLDFHHKDPNEKEFGIAQFARHVQWEILQNELKKCELICKNCHTLHHNEDTITKFNENFNLILEKSKQLENISRPELDSELIHNMLKNKYTINNIAKYLGKRPATILEIAEKLEIKYNEKLYQTRDEYNSNMQKIDRDELIVLYKKGMSVREISNHFNCAKSTLYSLIRDLKKEGKL